MPAASHRMTAQSGGTHTILSGCHFIVPGSSWSHGAFYLTTEWLSRCLPSGSAAVSSQSRCGSGRDGIDFQGIPACSSRLSYRRVDAGVPGAGTRAGGCLRRYAPNVPDRHPAFLPNRHPAFLPGRHSLRLWRAADEPHQNVVQIAQPPGRACRQQRARSCRRRFGQDEYGLGHAPGFRPITRKAA